MSPTHTTGWRPAVGVVVEVDHNVFGEGVVVDGAFVAVSALFAAAYAFKLAVAGQASARAMVPCPAWQMTRAHEGIVFAYETHSTRRAFAGTSIGSGGSRRL